MYNILCIILSKIDENDCKQIKYRLIRDIGGTGYAVFATKVLDIISNSMENDWITQSKC